MMTDKHIDTWAGMKTFRLVAEACRQGMRVKWWACPKEIFLPGGLSLSTQK